MVITTHLKKYFLIFVQGDFQLDLRDSDFGMKVYEAVFNFSFWGVSIFNLIIIESDRFWVPNRTILNCIGSLCELCFERFFTLAWSDNCLC